MFAKSVKIITVSVGLTVLLGLSATAQVQPGQKQRQAIQRKGTLGQNLPQRQQGVARKGMMPQGGAGQMAGIEGAAMRRYRAGSLERYLLPLNKRELMVVAKTLNLTEDQKTKLKDLYTQFFTAAKPIVETRITSAKAVVQALQGTSPSVGELQNLATPYLDADRDFLTAEFNFWIGFKSILNPQQQGQATQMLQKRIQAGEQMRPQGQQPQGQPGAGPAAADELDDLIPGF